MTNPLTESSKFNSLKTPTWSMTDSIVVTRNLCPVYAVKESRQANHQLLVASPAPSKKRMNKELIVLSVMLAVITIVSMIDVYWSFKTQSVLAETEQNPLGRWLIAQDGGDISLFMTVKMLGTMGVILAIPALYFFRRSWGMICASALCLFQCLLLVYFYIGHELFPC